jgi:hypothetical protein
MGGRTKGDGRKQGKGNPVRIHDILDWASKPNIIDLWKSGIR